MKKFLVMLLCLQKTISTDFSMFENPNSEPIIQTDTGIALLPQGSVALNAFTIFTSLFIKMEPPVTSSDINMCGRCEPSNELINRLITKKQCFTTNQIAPDFEFARFDKIDMKSCLKQCIKSPICKGFTYDNNTLAGPHNGKCILRRKRYLNLKPKLFATEVLLECILDIDRDTACGDQTTPLEKIFSNHNAQLIEKTWEDNIDIFEELKKSNNASNRQKRSWSSILPFAGTLLNLGLTAYEANRLSSHIHKVENQFQEFKNNVMTFQDSVIEFENHILKIVKDSSTEIENLQCKTNLVAYQLIKQQELLAWKLKLDEIFYHLRRGSLTGQVAPALLDKKHYQNSIGQPCSKVIYL